MTIKNILISQPEPVTGSPYTDLISKYGVQVDFNPFFKVEHLTAKDLRAQKVNILDYTAVTFTARTTIDAFFKICEEMRTPVPETMKYFCISEAIALYLQKHIVYRKRKIFFGDGTPSSIIDAIGSKHKAENFLIASGENCKPDFLKLFAKAKLKYTCATFIKTVSSDLTNMNLDKYDMFVFYSPLDIKSLTENFPEFKQGDKLFATFGQATAKALKTEKLTANILAPTPEAPSIAKALQLYFDKTK